MSLTKVSIFFVSIFIFAWGAYFAYGLYEDWKITKAYEASVKPYHDMYKAAEEYIRKGEQAAKKEKAMLQADHDGGKTPEETLALFVDALRKKDAQQAAKYYLPWLQEKAEEEMRDWIENYPDGLEKYIQTYDKSMTEIEMGDRVFSNYATINIYKNKGDKYHYSTDFELNKENSIWKISEL